MKVMIAKFAGVCAKCKEPVQVGEQIVWLRRGVIEHSGCPNELEAEGESDERGDEDERAGLEQGTLASDRRLAKQGLSVIRFSSGHVMTQNSRGRCIDAPCCGCCS